MGTINMSQNQNLPTTGFTRAKELIKFLPFGQTTLWCWAKEGKFPKPIKLSPTMTVWDNAEVHAWFDSVKNGGNNE